MGLLLTVKQQRGWDMLTDRNLSRIGFFGGARSGKTDLVIEYMIMRAFRYPGSRQLMARRARIHAKASLWNDTITKYLRNYIPEYLYSRDKSDLVLHFRNGSEIVVDGLDDKDRTEKVLGREFLTIYFNEATQMSHNTMQLALTRLAQNVRDEQDQHWGVQKFIMDANPRGPRHWVRKVAIEHVDPDSGEPLGDAAKWGVIPDWTPYDNKENLAAEYIELLEAMPSVMRQRMLEGKWVDNEGCVYSEFDEDLHICRGWFDAEDQPHYCPNNNICPRAAMADTTVGAVDFGFVNPFVKLAGALDSDKRLLIFDELYRAGVIVEDHAETIKKRQIRHSWIVADHAAGEAATLRRHGVFTRPADKSRKVTAGIDLVKARLKCQGDGLPRLEVCQYCRETIGEFYAYLWDEKKQEPLKENDHAMDALRYMVVELDGRARTTVMPVP